MRFVTSCLAVALAACTSQNQPAEESLEPVAAAAPADTASATDSKPGSPQLAVANSAAITTPAQQSRPSTPIDRVTAPGTAYVGAPLAAAASSPSTTTVVNTASNPVVTRALSAATDSVGVSGTVSLANGSQPLTVNVSNVSLPVAVTNSLAREAVLLQKTTFVLAGSGGNGGQIGSVPLAGGDFSNYVVPTGKQLVVENVTVDCNSVAPLSAIAEVYVPLGYTIPIPLSQSATVNGVNYARGAIPLSLRLDAGATLFASYLLQSTQDARCDVRVIGYHVNAP
jgi:hypothetical protein